MSLSKFLACTVSAVTVIAAVGCADGTGKALTPTLPTIDTTTNADGTRLKATTPVASAPRSSVRVNTLTPQLSVANATGTYGNATLSYEFEVHEGTTRLAASEPIGATSSAQTVWTVPSNTLRLNRTYSWRARATTGGVAGTWSDAATFRTPAPPPVDGPVSCGGSSGPSIIGCVGAAYPAKLVARVSLATRHANMGFIRDRIIETGRCKGHDFGRNFKRGTPVISHDYLVERRPGQRDRGIDLAAGFDELSLPLRLTWQVKGPPDYGFPYYAPYGPVDCSDVN